VLDSVFQLLFKYRPVIFQQGEFRLVPSTGSYVAALLVAVAIVATILTYRAARARGAATKHRIVLTSIRLATLGLMLFCLFRPVLVVRAAVSQQNFIGVLVDDSRSMQIADQGGQMRGAAVRQQLAPDSPLMKSLSEKFLVRTFAFSSATRRITTPKELAFSGSQTRLGAALEGARQELAGLPLAGLVMVSDGADSTDASLSDALLALKAADVPVFTVGVGEESLQKDIQIGRISVPRATLKGTSILVDAVVTHRGFPGETVMLDVEDEGRIVGSQEVRLPADGEPAAVRVRFTAAEAGPRLFRFKITPQPGEMVTQNNARETLIDVRDRAERILYFEGEPRFELKFIRRAVTDDANLRLVALQRTADNKYLRLGVDDADHLLGGFPRTREELFAYRGLILGSIEAGAFTGDQLRMISDFVEKRGGGLLALGGPRAFAEGSYTGTPVADVLPVVLERPTKALDAGAVARLKVHPTRDGSAHAVTQLGATEQASAAIWDKLPALTSVNPLRTVKPGATILLSGADERRRDQVVLAAQRYGRGKAIAFPVQDSWLWQMHADIAVDDMTHENYWRQLMRWLVDGVPDPVEPHTSAERVEAGESVTVTADVVDATFVEINDARVVAHIEGPRGTSDLPLQWTGERSGEYRAVFAAADEGLYTVRVEATRGTTSLGTGVTQLRAAPGDSEYFDAGMNAARLKRIADETGGRFYKAADAGALAEDVRYSGRGVTTTEERDLWHLPIVLGLILLLMCGEWGYRRAVGLA
jgi:uncharacterized membrane protein